MSVCIVRSCVRYHRRLRQENMGVLVSQQEARVEMFRRQRDGSCLMSVLDGLEAEWYLPEPELRVKLADIYRRVEFEQAGGQK